MGSTGKNPIKYYFAFEHNNDIQKYNVFELAEKCYRLWEDFINRNVG